MKAKCKCPGCKKIVIDECAACIKYGTLSHVCEKGKEPNIFEVKWEIIDG